MQENNSFLEKWMKIWLIAAAGGVLLLVVFYFIGIANATAMKYFVPMAVSLVLLFGLAFAGLNYYNRRFKQPDPDGLTQISPYRNVFFKGANFMSIIILICGVMGAFLLITSPQPNYYNAMAIIVVVVWTVVFLRYFVWATYFYNINYGLTDHEWAEIFDARRKVARGEIVAAGATKGRDANPYEQETFGLPKGTVRGMIAFTLLFGGLAMLLASIGADGRLDPDSFFWDHFEFFKTAFLMMIAFYFGEKSLQYFSDNNNSTRYSDFIKNRGGQGAPPPSGSNNPKGGLGGGNIAGGLGSATGSGSGSGMYGGGSEYGGGDPAGEYGGSNLGTDEYGGGGEYGGSGDLTGGDTQTAPVGEQRPGNPLEINTKGLGDLKVMMQQPPMQEKTMNDLSAEFVQIQDNAMSKFITDENLQDAVDDIKSRLNLTLNVAALKAVIQVEAGGSGFLKTSGRAKILFEGHVFWRSLEYLMENPDKDEAANPSAKLRVKYKLSTDAAVRKGEIAKVLEKLSKENGDVLYKKWTKEFYRGGEGEYDRLECAKTIHEQAAIYAASWGKFQILGENLLHNIKGRGYANAVDFEAKQQESEVFHLADFIEFCTTKKLKGQSLIYYLSDEYRKATGSKEFGWADFALGYNGSGYKENKYDEKLQQAYDRFSKA